jgi:hypothetical protein
MELPQVASEVVVLAVLKLRVLVRDVVLCLTNETCYEDVSRT